MADPEFFIGGGGHQPQRRLGANLLFGIIFAENCMEMKKKIELRMREEDIRRTP